MYCETCGFNNFLCDCKYDMEQVISVYREYFPHVTESDANIFALAFIGVKGICFPIGRIDYLHFHRVCKMIQAN